MLIRSILFLQMLFGCFLHAKASDYSIVFVHIGASLPPYFENAVCQARLFNPHGRIVLLASEQALVGITPRALNQHIEVISCESLEFSKEHTDFCQRTAHAPGFWRYTSERFLYIYDFMLARGETDVFHLENDVMLYADLGKYLHKFQAAYAGIAATFDNDRRCIPGFLYIANPVCMQRLAEYFAKNAHMGNDDMGKLALFRLEEPPSIIDYLPIVPSGYTTQYPLISRSNQTTDHAISYFRFSDHFMALFDAAAIGQYLGGTMYGKPGFINETCLFNPSYFMYEWIKDEKGRKVPYVIFNGQRYHLMNLHIHSKLLHLFSSEK